MGTPLSIPGEKFRVSSNTIGLYYNENYYLCEETNMNDVERKSLYYTSRGENEAVMKIRIQDFRYRLGEIERIAVCRKRALSGCI